MARTDTPTEDIGPSRALMRLAIRTPGEPALEAEADKVIVEGDDGWFCLRPRHVDFVSALVPGVLLFTTADGTECVVAVDEGILVKCGLDVRVSVRKAVRGDDLQTLRATVEAEFLDLDEHESHARSALTRLEAGAVRRFLQLAEHRR